MARSANRRAKRADASNTTAGRAAASSPTGERFPEASGGDCQSGR